MKNFFEIWFYELCEMLKDGGILIFVVFVPLCYPLLYSYIYTNEVVRDIPTVIVDDNDSKLSRQYMRDLDATPEIKVVARGHSMAEAKQWIMRHEAYGIIHIPNTFDLDLRRGDQTHVGLYCDLSSLLYYKGLLIATTNVTMATNRDIKLDYHLGHGTRRADEITAMPIEYDYVTLYNPQSGFAAFLIPPVLMLIIHQTLLLGMGMHMGRTRERWGGCLFPLRREFKYPVTMVLGRVAVYFLLYMVWAFYSFTLVTKWFGLPQLGDPHVFFQFIIAYLLSCTMFSLVMSILVYRREDCIMLFVFLSVPLLFMSGVSWPYSAIPEFWKAVGRIFPSTFGMNGYVRICTMGASIDDVMPEYTGLWIQAGCYFLIALLAYRIQLIKVKHRDKLYCRTMCDTK